MAKVSIIVPLYNMENYISKTLDSLVKQSYKDIEILCINDGSTDSSLEIIEFFVEKDSRVVLFNKLNGGIADTRNFGLKKVNSDYFMFVDSDDWVESDFVELLLNKAIETDSDIVTSDFYWTYNNSEKYQNDGPFSTKNELLTNMFATLWNKIYKTSWIKSLDIDFPTGYRYEDASFLYKVVPYVRKWSHVNQALVHYVQREGSITHNHNDKVKDMIFVFDDLQKFYMDRNLVVDYKYELEYLFIRFFLGNSFLRTCQIKEKNDRKKTLELSYRILVNNFPNWRKNIYLKKNSLKNFVFKKMNKFNYYVLAYILNKIYLIKK